VAKFVLCHKRAILFGIYLRWYQDILNQNSKKFIVLFAYIF